MTSTLSLSEPARDRIIRITNVHFKADAQFIVNMFDGFTIVDQMRTVNTRTGTNSVVYILFGTIADRIRSTELNGLTIVDREIKIQPAREGNFALNESETAFFRPNARKKLNRRAPRDDPVAPDTPGSPSATFKDSDFPALGPAPATEDAHMKTPAVPIPVSGNTSTPLVAAKADFATAIRNPSMTSGKDINAQKDECKSPRSYDDMRETSNPASATLSSPKKTAHVKSEDRTKSYVPAQTYGLPDDINMNIPPAANNKNWNLGEHDPNDRSKNLITPDDWCNFGRNAFKDVEAEQKAKGTNVDRLVKDDGGFDADDKGKFAKK